MKETLLDFWYGVTAKLDPYMWKWWFQQATARFHYPPGTIFESCNYHPVIVLKNEQGMITGWDMADSCYHACDQFHCGLVKITQFQAMQIIALYQEKGQEGLDVQNN